MAKKRDFLAYEHYDPTTGSGGPREWRREFKTTMGFEEAQRMVSADHRSPEEILGVAMGASWMVIAVAYRRQAMACHPDRCAIHGLPVDVATRRFQVLTAAMTMLEYRRS